ncbi:tripartite tricarboxylate transporter substrate binding protein [Variovorax rhizosphaerae]|uniref:Tripartite tricarboxylate transporter substrate binding protein n=1 Tax=Variovorax rhizosphaerae TaxID=1836200 RepID=A0ABU8WWI7_9BURK
MSVLMRTILVALASALVSVQAYCQTEVYPSRGVRMLVPYSAGSGVDLLARSFAHGMEGKLKNPVVVENREGATGLIGTQAAARSPADGYTLLANANPPFMVAPLSLQPPPYDVLKAFAPVARIGSVPLVMIIAADSPVKGFAQLRDYAKAHPDKATYSSTGNGSPGQLFMETVKATTGLQLREVPYKSSTQALTDLIGGQVLTSIVSLPAADQLIQNGRLRVLAVGSRERLARFPDAPTLSEVLGSPLEASVWYGFLVPAGVAPEKIALLHSAVATVFDTEEARKSMQTLGIIPDLQSPTQFAASLRQDAEAARRMLSLVEQSKTTP